MKEKAAPGDVRYCGEFRVALLGSRPSFQPHMRARGMGGFLHPYGTAEGRTPLFSPLPPAPRAHPPSHPIPPYAGGDSGWADSEVDSSCAGQPIHLWQFLKELLLKPHNYGRFIRWLNKEKGGWALQGSGPGGVTPNFPSPLPS